MKRTEIIAALRKYFSIDELVCEHVYRRDANMAWRYLSTEILATLLAVREILDAPMSINNYRKGYSQRGLRCNLCELVASKRAKHLYMSAHILGQAFDATVEGMSAEEAREIIKANADKLPFPIRIEKDVQWLHIDTFDNGYGQKITEFKG